MAGMNYVFLSSFHRKVNHLVPSGCIRSIFIVAFLALIPGRPVLGQSVLKPVNTDSLLELLVRTPAQDTGRIALLKSLATHIVYKDARKATAYAREAIDLMEKNGMKPDPKTFIFLGKAYDKIPDLKNAVEAFRRAIAIAQEQKAPEKLIAAYEALGWHFYRTQELSSSILNFEMALETAELIQFKQGTADATFGLALVYTVMEDRETQYRLLTKYIGLANPDRDQRRIADAFRNLGEYYRLKKDFVTAINFYQKSFETASSTGDSALMGIAINTMAWAYYEKGDLAKSLEIYERNFDFTLSQGKAQTIANIYGNIGNIYRDWERYPEAIEYYQKSIDVSLEANDFFNLSWLFRDMSLMYARMGDYRKAYESASLHAVYNDSLMASNYQRKIISAQLQFEADRKAKELEMLALRLERNRYLIYGLAGSLGLLITIALIILMQLRNKSRMRVNALDRRISELTQSNLRQQMNPHFIFNTLNSIQYYVFQNDRIASNNYMTKFASLIRKTLENSRHTAITIKEELDALELYLELEALRFKEKFDWTLTIDEDLDTLAYKIPTMLIQPYVENAIMHGLMHKEGKGLIRIDLSFRDNLILCTIEDNGIGRDKSREINREKNHHHQSLGTTITESRLKLVNELYGRQMQVSYTDLTDHDGNPSGTRVEISIPIIT